ncbi:barstar family protein [Plantactinospora sp. WMMB334]|uniref:barstar family protein n=1 Tax=Plantactinospora sp. WMMB334 TaxID=3404119 RepID=UPI003B933515
MDTPIYSLVDEVTRNTLVVAEDLSGFFIDSGDLSPEVTFLRVHEIGTGMRRVEDGILRVINVRREKIGEYFVGRAVRGDIGEDLGEGIISTVSYPTFGNRCEYSGAANIWRRWASCAALEKDEWLRWPMDQHDDWLHVVQNSWFASSRRAGSYGTDHVAYLDGAKMPTKPGFYCALGEAVNGPGGYFGSNLDALADCLSSDLGDVRLVRVVWRNFRASQDHLGDGFVQAIINLLSNEFAVEVSIV